MLQNSHLFNGLLGFSQVLLGDKWLAAIDTDNNGYIWNSHSIKKQPIAFSAIQLLGLGNQWILTEAKTQEYHLMRISFDTLQPVTELTSYQFNNNKTCLGAIDKDGAFQVWNLETLTKTDIDGNYNSSRVLAISSSGRSVLLEESSDRDYRYWLHSLNGTAATRTELVGEKAPVAGARIFRIHSARFDAAEEKLVADLIDPQKGDGLIEVFGRWAIWELANIKAGPSPRPSEEIVDDWAIQRESSQIICQNTRTPTPKLEVNIKVADKPLAVSQNAKWIVTSLDHDVVVHSVSVNGEFESASLIGHETRPNTAAISADNAWLVSSDDMSSRIWPLTLDRIDTEPIRISNLPSGIREALTSDDESKFYAALDDNPVEFKIPFQQRPESHVLKESCQTLRSLSISKRGNRLAAVSGYLYPPVVYDLDRMDNHSMYPLGKEPIDAVRGIDFSDDGNWMTVSTFSLGSGLWRFDEDRRAFFPIEFAGLEQSQQNLYRSNQRILLLPNPKYLLTADEKFSPHLWRLENRAELCDNELPSEMKRATFVTRVPKSTWVILRTNDGSLLLWDAQAPNKVKTLNVPSHYIPKEFSNQRESEEEHDQCQISPNGQWLVLRGSDTSVRLISVQNPKLTKILAEGIKAQLRTWFSPDSRSLIVANKDLQLWKLTPTAIASPASLGSADFNISRAVFTSNGRELITGSTSGLVQLYDLADTNFSPIDLQAHRGPIQAMKLIAGESRVVGISGGSTMISRLWKQESDKVKRLSDLIELSKDLIGKKQADFAE